MAHPTESHLESMKKVSLIVPCYNEERNLDALYVKLRPLLDNGLGSREYDWEVIMIDDGSRDASLAVMEGLRCKDARINVLSLSRNFGKECAMLAGFDYASGDCAVILDADLQDPVEVIPEMLKKWEEGYKDVYGNRETRGNEPWVRKRFTFAYYNILSKVSSGEVLRNVGDFRLLDRCCIDEICGLRETQRYTKGLYSWIGFSKSEVSYDRSDRNAGKSSFSYRKLVNLAIEGITSHTTSPLRFASVMGIVVAVAAMAFLVYVLVKTLVYGDPVAGYPTLICVILFLGGIQLLSLGIIGEYIGRIFLETKGRPPYIVASFNGANPHERPGKHAG